MPPLGNSTILRELRSGNHDIAFQALWDRFGDLLHWYAARKLASVHNGAERVESAAVSGFGRFAEDVIGRLPEDVPGDLEGLKRLAVKHALRSADRKRYVAQRDSRRLCFDSDAIQQAQQESPGSVAFEHLREILAEIERKLPPEAFEIALLAFRATQKPTSVGFGRFQRGATTATLN
jgi:hypothetical protein